MADIRIDFQGNLTDGQVITFQAPCDCTAVDALKIYYVNGEEKLSRRFVMKDAHGNDLAGIGNLFMKDAYVKVILNTVSGFAYLQNADTNGYLENKIGQLSNPNLLINGDFRVNQRGATTYEKTSTTKYTVDRWKANADMVVTVNENSITVTNQGTSDLYFTQPFEKALNGTYTFSCNVLNMSGVAWLYNFHQFKLSTGVNTKVITDNLTAFTFGLEAGASIELEWAKLEQGSVATPFVPRLIGEELLLCQRYYQKFYKSVYLEETYIPGKKIPICESLSVEMRATPTARNLVVKESTLAQVTRTLVGIDVNKYRLYWMTFTESNPSGQYYYYCELDAEIYN